MSWRMTKLKTHTISTLTGFGVPLQFLTSTVGYH